jgi:hypothetical protein
MGLKAIGFEEVKWICMPQGKDRYGAFVNTEMKFFVPSSAGSFLTICATIGFSRRTLFIFLYFDFCCIGIGKCIAV